MAKITVLDKIRKSTDEIMEDLKWPLRLKAINRAADSFEDAIESERITQDQVIIDLRKKLTTSKNEDEARKVWKQIAEARIKIQEAEKLAQIVKDERNYLSSEAKDE